MSAVTASQRRAMLKEFLAALFPPETEGVVELRALPGGVQEFVAPTDVESVEHFIAENAGKNIYFGVASRRDATSGALVNCGQLAALFVDLDFKAVPEDEARKRLARFPLPPSIVNNSGGGLHAYWLLREPADLQTEAVFVKALLRRLASNLGADLAAAEPARILRVPGTENTKYAPPPVVHVEHRDLARRYTLADLDRRLPPDTRDDRAGSRFRMPEVVEKGARNPTLYRLGRSLAARGLSNPAIRAALHAENAVRCRPPLDGGEVEEIAGNTATQADRPGFHGAGATGWSFDGSPNSIPPYMGGVGKETNFHPRKAADILAEPATPINWVWEPFLPSGILALVAAFMKVGKSTWVYALAVAIALGRPFLDYPTKQGAVLILAVEEHPRDVRRRLERFGMRRDDPIHIHTGPLDNSPETFEALRKYILEHGITLVILDTLARFWTVTDENANAEVVRQVSPLLDLARDTGAVVVLVHHERKTGGEDGRGIRGGSALFGLVDQALLLERRQGGDATHRVLKTIGRYDETPRELILHLDADEYRKLGTAEEVDQRAAKSKVSDALTDEPRTVAALTEESGLTQKAVRKALEALRGQHIREGAGKKGDPYTYRRAPDSIRSQPDPKGEETNPGAESPAALELLEL